MERLDIIRPPKYQNIEASIHFARYALAKDYVRGRVVLDLACGEGYGSFLLRQAGAKRVVGVDIDLKTIDRAKETFAGDGVEFIVADACSASQVIKDEKFDVIVSIETFEHVSDANGLLSEIRKLSKSNTIIIISCPNDYWYFKGEDEGNPFHVRKYHLSEFQKMSVDVLGSNVRWGIGTAALGFTSLPLNRDLEWNKVSASWISYIDLNVGYLVRGTGLAEFQSEQASYYIGIWNSHEFPVGAAITPLSMDQYSDFVSQNYEALKNPSADEHPSKNDVLDLDENILNRELNAELVTARNEIKKLMIKNEQLDLQVKESEFERAAANEELRLTKENNANTHRDLRHLSLRMHAVISEIKAVREYQEYLTRDTQLNISRRDEEIKRLHEEITRIRDENVELRVGYERYIRFRKILPTSIRSAIMRGYRAMKS